MWLYWMKVIKYIKLILSPNIAKKNIEYHVWHHISNSFPHLYNNNWRLICFTYFLYIFFLQTLGYFLTIIWYIADYDKVSDFPQGSALRSSGSFVSCTAFPLTRCDGRHYLLPLPTTPADINCICRCSLLFR